MILLSKESLLILLTAFLSIPGMGQSALTLKFHQYSTNNGLGSTNVRKTIQDKKGFTWIATQDGLYRFDGNQFEAYNKSLDPNHSITGSDIRDIALVKETLWIINSFGGIDGIDIISGRVIFQWKQQSDRRLGRVLLQSMVALGDSLLIGSTKGLFLFSVHSKKLYAFFPFSGIEQRDTLPISKIILDQEKRLWLFHPNAGISVLTCSTLKLKKSLYEPDLYYYDAAIFANSIIGATSAGIIKYTLSTTLRNDGPAFPSIAEAKNTSIFAVNVENEHAIWFSLRNYLIKAVGQNYYIIRQHKLSDGDDWTKSVFAINFDKRNNIWLGCQQGLAYASTEPSAMISFTKSTNSGDQIMHAYTLFPENDSVLYACAEDGLYQINQQNGNIRVLDKGKSYFYIFKNRENKILVSND
jgi:ligand-binding sensor domain-containing protein